MGDIFFINQQPNMKKRERDFDTKMGVYPHIYHRGKRVDIWSIGIYSMLGLVILYEYTFIEIKKRIISI